MTSRIEIATRTLGKTSRFDAIGTLDRREEGAVITYPIEGDVSSLEIFHSHLILDRRGENDLHALFSVGEHGIFRMSFAGRVSELPIFTHIYKVYFSQSEIFLRLTYDLGSGPSSQKFFLKIHIQVLSEDQWK